MSPHPIATISLWDRSDNSNNFHLTSIKARAEEWAEVNFNKERFVPLMKDKQWLVSLPGAACAY